MKYNRYEIGPYNLHVINIDKFKKNIITVNFKRKVLKEEVTIRSLLANILVRTTNNLKTEREMAIKKEELYSIGYGSGSYISGNYHILYQNVSFLNEKYTEENMLEKSLDFLMDIIFNQNVEKNAFNKKVFELAKEEVKKNIDSIEEAPSAYAHKRMYETMDKKAPYSFLISGYMEDLDKINPTKLYDYYKSVLQSDAVDIFVVGDIEADNIKKMITDKFKVNTLKKPGTTHFLTHDKYRKTVKKVIEKKKLKQSQLIMGFKVKNLTDFEMKYVSNIYNYVLGGGPDSKLFRTVREKNSLCYSIRSRISKVNSIMTISAGINTKNFKKALRLIKKELKNMEQGHFTEEDINNAKTIYTSSVQTLMDTPFDILGLYESQEYLNFDLPEVRLKENEKVTKSMVIELAKKIKLDTIYLLEGEEDETSTTN